MRRVLHEGQVDQIRRRRAAGEKLLAIAVDYGITEGQVSKICRLRRWAPKAATVAAEGGKR